MTEATWYTFEVVAADGETLYLFERICNLRQAQLQAASLLRRGRWSKPASAAHVFSGRKDDDTGPLLWTRAP